MSRRRMQFSGRETIWVLGYPKSGNTWLCRLLGDVLESPIHAGLRFPSNADEGFDRKGRYVIRMRHHNLLKAPFPGDKRLIQIVRDPRDVLCSTKNYWELKGWGEALEKCKNWQPNNREWLPKSPFIRFEDLLEDPPRFLTRVLIAIGLEASSEAVLAAVDRQSWKKRLERVEEEGLPYGSHHQRKVLGRGRDEIWKDDLHQGAAKMAHPLFWPLMQELGYEDDEKWYEQIPQQVMA